MHRQACNKHQNKAFALMRTYLKPGEMNDLFTMKTYIYNLKNDGEGEIGKNKEKNPFGYLPVLPSMMWRTDCFLVSTRTENKPDYSYVRSGYKLLG